MKLDEINYSWSKGLLNTAFKAAKSDQPDTNKSGQVKVDARGNIKTRSSPLSSMYGQQRALRDSDGKIIGAGGEMHSPMSPDVGRQILAQYKSESEGGTAPTYGQLPDLVNTSHAIKNRARRSAPNRAAQWKDGEGKDPRSKLFGKRRTIVTPKGRKVTRTKPAPPSSKEKQPAELLTDPELIDAYRSKMQRRQKRAKAGLTATTKRKGPKGRSGKRKVKFRESVEDFVAKLDEVLYYNG